MKYLVAISDRGRPRHCGDPDMKPKLKWWQLLVIEIIFLLSLPFMAIVAFTATVVEKLKP
jgi:maltodextrin utilization protein YvdJ